MIKEKARELTAAVSFVIVFLLFPLGVFATSGTFNENFTSQTFENTAVTVTTANWDTVDHYGVLPRANQFAETTGVIDWGGGVRAITYTAGIWIIGGDDGKINEYDGTYFYNFSIAAGFGTDSIQALGYNGSYWLLGGSGSKLKKWDGTTWTDYSSGYLKSFSGNINAIAYKTTPTQLWLIGGGAGSINTFDGTNFVNHATDSNYTFGGNDITSITWNGSYFLVAGKGGRIEKYDGTTWTDYSAALAASGVWNGTYDINSIDCNGTTWLIGGGAGRIATFDGSTFTNRTGSLNQSAFSIYSIKYNSTGGFWLVGGKNGTITALYSTTDFVTYNLQTNLFNSGDPIWAMASNAGNTFIGGGSARFYLRTGGATTPVNTDYSTSIRDFGKDPIRCSVWNGSYWLIGGNSGDLNKYDPGTSTYTDLKAGLTAVNFLSNVNSIAWDSQHGYFLIGGANGALAKYDGTTFTLETAPLNFGANGVNAICWASGKWLIGGDNGMAALSTNGTSFTSETAELSTKGWSGAAIRSIAWLGSSDGVFVIGGDGGAFGVFDGLNHYIDSSGSISGNINVIRWNSDNTTAALVRIGTSNGNLYEAVGYAGGFFSSINSLTIKLVGWSSTPILSMDWDGSKWFIAGGNGKMNSDNGTATYSDISGQLQNWGGQDVNTVAFGNSGECLAGGNNAKMNLFGNAYSSPGTLQSVSVAHWFANFQSITFTATSSLNTGAISYWISSNNGATWIPVTSGVGVWFDGRPADAGTDILWKSTLTTFNNFLSPILNTVRIDWTEYPAPTYTITPTFTNTPTCTVTPTITKTLTFTPTFTVTATITQTYTPTTTPSITMTSTYTFTPTTTKTVTQTVTPSTTPTITQTVTQTVTPTVTQTITQTVTPSTTPTITQTVTPSTTPTITQSNTQTVTPSTTPTITETVTPTVTGTVTQTITETVTPSTTPTITETVTPTVTRTVTQTVTQTVTPSITFTTTQTITQTVTPTVTNTVTQTITQTVTPTFTRTVTLTITKTVTMTITFTITITVTNTTTPTITQTVTQTSTPTFTASITQTVTQSTTPTMTTTITATTTGTVTQTTTQTVTQTVTQTTTPTVTATATPTMYADHLQIIATPPEIAGVPFYVTVLAKAPLSYGDIVFTGYSGTVDMTSNATSYFINPVSYTYVGGLDNGSHIFQVQINNTGTKTITADDSVITPAVFNINLTTGSAVSFSIQAPSTAAAGQTVYITVTAKDAYNNIVTGYTGTVGFTSTDTFATLPGDTAFTLADAGVKILPVIMKTKGIQTISGHDDLTPTINGTSNAINVTAGSVFTFQVVAPSTANQGISFNYAVTAIDQYNNVVDNYTGTVHFTSTDGLANLPADYTYQATDFGSRIFSAKLNASGTWTITATDSVAAKNGKSNSIVVSASASQYSQPMLLTSYLSAANTYEYTYLSVSESAWTILPNSNLEFDVFVPDYSASFYCSIEENNEGAIGTLPAPGYLRDYGPPNAGESYIKDQNNIRIHPSTDISAYARGQWYHRKFDLSALATYKTGEFFLSQDTGNLGLNGAPSNTQGTFNAVYDNVRFSNSSGSTIMPIFINDNKLPINNLPWSFYNATSHTADSWNSLEANTYIFILKDMILSVLPAVPVPANGATCATITANVTRPDGGPVYGALIDFTSNRPGDIITPLNLLAGNSKAVTDLNGNASASIKSSQAGSALVTATLSHMSRITTVNFISIAASKVAIIPGSLSLQTNVPGSLQISAQDINGNNVSVPQNITMTSTSGTLQFSKDNGITWSTFLPLPGTQVSNILVRDSIAENSTISATAAPLTIGTAAITINDTPATVLSIIPVSQTALAGNTASIVVQAKDGLGNNANSNAVVTISTAFSTTMQFSLDNNNWFSSINVTLASGKASLYYMDTKNGQNVTITAHDNASVMTDGKGYATTISNIPALLSAFASATSAPISTNLTITASLTDQYGNPIANTWISFVPLASGGAPVVTPGGNSTNAAGQVVINYKTGAAVDNMNYCVVNSANVLGTTVIIYISGAATKIVPNPNPMSLGADYIGNLIINLQDANNFNAPPPVGAHTGLSITAQANMQYSLDGITWLPLNTPLGFTVDASGYALIKVKSHIPATYSPIVKEWNPAPALTQATETINITMGYFIRISPSAATGTVYAPAGSAVRVTAYVTDQNGIPQALANIPVTFDSNYGSINPQNGVTYASGTITADLTLSIQSGIGHIVTATMSNPSGVTQSAIITSQPVISFAVTAPGTALRSWGPYTNLYNIIVRAKDAYGQTVTNYLGTVNLTGTDPLDTLPGNHTFVSGDAGVYQFTNVKFGTDGTWTITAKDTVNVSETGTSNNILVSDPPTFTATPTITKTVTATITQTSTPTVTKTITTTNTQTVTPTITQTVTQTMTQTVTQSITQTVTQTITQTNTKTVTLTNTQTVTQTITPTSTQTSTLTTTKTNTQTVTQTVTQSVTPTFTQTMTLTVTKTTTNTVTQTVTQTNTMTITDTTTPTVTRTITQTVTQTVTTTVTNTVTPTTTATNTQTVTPTFTITVTFTITLTSSPTPSITATSTITMTHTVTPIYTYTATPTITITETYTFTPTVTATVTGTHTPTVTLTSTVTITPSFTQSVTPTITYTITITMTPTFTSTITVTFTDTPTGTITATFTTTPSITLTSTTTQTTTPMPTPTITPTFTPTPDVVLIYPNPLDRSKAYNKSLKIELPWVCDVDIYNIQAYLIFEAKGVSGKIEWDGKNKAGEEVSPGVYYYVIKTPSGKLSGKIFLVK